MKNGDFVYISAPIPKIEPLEHKDFILNLQKSMLLSLVKRNLLTHTQMESVMIELGKQFKS